MKVDATLVVAIVGFVTPFVTALVTKLHASRNVKSVVAFVVTAAGIAAGSLANVTGLISVKQLIGAFIAAGAVAGGSRQWLTQDQVNSLAVITKDIGLGGKTPVLPGQNAPHVVSTGVTMPEAAPGAVMPEPPAA